MLTMNQAETEALVRAIDGLFDFQSVTLDRRDSFDNPHSDGFLIVTVHWNDGGTSADAISDIGTTTVWNYR